MHEILRVILKHYWLPHKIISIIQKLYDAYVLSPLRFLLINRVSRTAYSSLTIKQWTLSSRLEDVDFADDICTLSHRLQDSQNQAINLETTAKQNHLYINVQKTKTLIINSNQTDSIKIRYNKVKDKWQKRLDLLRKYCQYFRGTDEDIRTRKRKVQQAFVMLGPVWRSRKLRPNSECLTPTWSQYSRMD